MVNNINILYNEKDKSFASLLEDSLNQIVEKNNDVEFKFTHNSTPSKINLLVNKIDKEILSTDNLNIVVNTIENKAPTKHNAPEISFFYKDVDNEIHTLEKNDNKKFWIKAYDLLTALNINVNKNKYIYIAPCSIEQDVNRDILHRQFSKEGFEILPYNNIKQTKEQIERDISKSEFSIHILDENFGKQDSISEYYNKIAADYISSKYTTNEIQDQLRFIWISPELSFFDEKQQLKLEQFRQDVKALKGAEILQTPIELLKNLLKNRIVTGFNSTANESNSNNCIYLVHEQDDNIEIITQNLSKESINYISPVFTENVIKEHRKMLIEAADVVICGFNKNKNWIFSKTRDILKAPGFGKKLPFNSVTLLVNDKSKYQNLDLPIDILDGDEKAINLFIKKFKN